MLIIIKVILYAISCSILYWDIYQIIIYAVAYIILYVIHFMLYYNVSTFYIIACNMLNSRLSYIFCASQWDAWTIIAWEVLCPSLSLACARMPPNSQRICLHWHQQGMAGSQQHGALSLGCGTYKSMTSAPRMKTMDLRQARAPGKWHLLCMDGAEISMAKMYVMSTLLPRQTYVLHCSQTCRICQESHWEGLIRIS